MSLQQDTACCVLYSPRHFSTINVPPVGHRGVMLSMFMRYATQTLLFPTDATRTGASASALPPPGCTGSGVDGYVGGELHRVGYSESLLLRQPILFYSLTRRVDAGIGIYTRQIKHKGQIKQGQIKTGGHPKQTSTS